MTKESSTAVTAKKNTVLSRAYVKTTAIDGFAPGYCTAYAAQRRPDIFKGPKAFLGNAKEWNERAKAAGWTLSNVPTPGAIAVYEPGQGGASGYGHVAIVESVDRETNTMVISDMNGPGGRGVVTTRVTPINAGSYIP